MDNLLLDRGRKSTNLETRADDHLESPKDGGLAKARRQLLGPGWEGCGDPSFFRSQMELRPSSDR